MGIQKIFKNQITDPKQYGGLVDTDHLGWNGATEPVYVRNQFIDKVYELNYGADNLVSFVNKLPKFYIDREGEYRWMLQGATEFNYALVRATIDAAGTTEVTDTHKAGLLGQIFYMWFNEEVPFRASSTLTSNHPDDYSLRAASDGVTVGALRRFEVQITTSDETKFVPASELVSGSRWVDNYGLVENKLSVAGTGMSFATNFELKNTTSVIRKDYDVPGNMLENHPLKFKFQMDDGKTFEKWIPYQDWNFHTQFRRDKARLILNGKNTVLSNGNSLLKGVTGNTIKAGYGMYEQMNFGNILPYTKFSVDNLADFVLQMSIGKIPEDKRSVVISTGEYGAGLVHRGLMDKAAGYPWLQSSHNLKMNGGKITLDEGQMVGYKFLNGVEFKIIIDPMKDDHIHNPLMHKDGGTVASRTFDIFDFGTTNGKANIQQVAVTGNEEFYGYINGMRDAFNPYNNLGRPRQMASSKDGYSVYKQYIGGVAIFNPLKTARYLPVEYFG